MKLYVDIGWSSLSKDGEELCGDNVEVVRTGDAVVAVLADGLGSGVKANILSKMTAKIIATMLEKGATLEEVVETVGNTLPICQKRHLAYSTFSIIRVKDDGEIYIVEFDNPSVFFFHEGHNRKITFKETEICSKKIRETQFQGNPGDILVAVSDGIIHAGIGAVLNLGWQWGNVAEYLERIVKPVTNAKGLSQSLLTVCNQLYGGKPGDDSTVMALQIRVPVSMTVAVGPPLNKDDDSNIVRQLLDEEGTRVVCGGTTGTIVARALRQEIQVNMEELNEEVPPTGKLTGIDLVTEGIITLSKALEYLKTALANGEIPEKKNGASALAKALFEGDQIHFLVGRAINPSHQNPNLPINLALKMQVVREIAEILQSMGKQVTVKYF